MKPLSLSDIENLQDYEISRPQFRQRVIEVKKRRRVPLGPVLSLVFENSDTVRFQVQEMLRVERIVRPDKVEEELAVYNELLPGPGEVAATLFIEVTDPAQVQPVLDRFVGLDEPGRLYLSVGDEQFPARFAPGQSREDRISAVHYIRFALGDSGRGGLERGNPAVLSVDHAGYSARTFLPADTVDELLRDLDA